MIKINQKNTVIYDLRVDIKIDTDDLMQIIRKDNLQYISGDVFNKGNYQRSNTLMHQLEKLRGVRGVSYDINSHGDASYICFVLSLDSLNDSHIWTEVEDIINSYLSE